MPQKITGNEVIAVIGNVDEKREHMEHKCCYQCVVNLNHGHPTTRFLPSNGLLSNHLSFPRDMKSLSNQYDTISSGKCRYICGTIRREVITLQLIEEAKASRDKILGMVLTDG
uniref:Uncharacterized protein n=1 Tax=Romanomermis culicivorax TaxID=13658 RepID=A0A915JK16_ROMCU